MRRPRLLPLLAAALALLALAKADRLLDAPSVAAQAQAPAAPPAAPAATPAPPVPPAPDVAAERAVLEALRARRAEIEARESACPFWSASWTGCGRRRPRR